MYFSSSSQPFVKVVHAQDKLPTFENIRDDFIQQEMRLEMVVGMDEEE